MFRIVWNSALTTWLLLGLCLTPVLAQRPAFNELLGRADQAMAAGDLDKAISLYEKLANFYPNSAQAHNKLGLAHFKKGNDPRAIYSFRQSLALARDNDEALHNLVLASGRQADTLAKEARFVEAAQNLDELLRHYSWHPQYAVIVYYRGRLEFLRGQPLDGLAWWKKAANLAPDSGVAKVVAAQTRPMGPSTVALYQEALTKVATEPAFDLLLGDRYLDAGQPAEALAAYLQGLAKCQQTQIPFPLLSLKAGQAALTLGDPATAIPILEEAKVQRPDWASIRTTLWAAYLASKESVKADQALQEAFELDGRPKLALLGDTAAVRMTTPGGALVLNAATAVSPTPGKLTMSVGDSAPLELELGPNHAVIYRLANGRLSLESQAELSRGSSQEGALAPALVAKDRRGNFYRLSDALLKRPIVVVFWSANSPDPVELLTGLGALWTRYGGDLEAVAIHTEPSAQKQAHQIYLSQPGTTAQLWGDASSGKDFGIADSPAVVVIDRQGRIVRRETAPSARLFVELPAFIDSLP